MPCEDRRRAAQALAKRSAATVFESIRSAARRPWGPRKVAAFAGAGILATALVVWTVVTLTTPEPRARQYLDFKACLLTDQQGIIGKEAGPVWAGMQRASLKTHARVQFLPVMGPQNAGNAVPYLNSLVQRKCDLVIAAGEVPASATAQFAPRFPKSRFVIVGAGHATANVQVVDPARTDVAATIAETVEDAVDDSGQ